MLIRKHLFIVNPAAGNKNKESIKDEIREIFIKMREADPLIEYIIEFTEYEGHALDLAKKYSSQDKYIIYAVGGDGTLNETLNGMAQSDSVLAFVPYGTANDFMKSLYPGFRKETILRDTIHGYIEKIDLCNVNERYFVNIASIGIDASVNSYANKYKKNGEIKGKKAYIKGIIDSLKIKHNRKYKIRFNDQEMEKELILLAMANGKSYGGGFHIAPHAMLTDGLMDVVMAGNIGLLSILKLIPKLIMKTHLEDHLLEFYRTSKIEIIPLDGKDVLVNADGHEFRVNDLRVEIQQKALKFIYPLISSDENS